MFDGDLSEQHSSLYGTTRFRTKAKETSWGKGISNKFMQVMSNGAFTGINLSEGGSKPPQNRLESPRGINIWTVEDDTAYAQTVAKAISNDGDIDIQIAGIDETDDGYEIVFIQDGKIGMQLVSKDLATTSESTWLVTLGEGEIASRLKTISIDAKRIAILFEVWDSTG